MSDLANPNLPLAGVRVIDFTVVISGPSGTMLLADMGAEIIRVESIQENTRGRGAPVRVTKQQVQPGSIQARGYPNGDPGERPWNRQAGFNAHARNKLSMSVDLRKREGMEVLARLIKVSDVVIENHATDAMEGWGITFEWLKGIKPDIIMVRMPGFGTEGPYRNWRTFGSTAESQAGRSFLSGYRDMDASNIPWVFPADAAGGASAAFATITALLYRKRTGKGQLVDLALAENILQFMGVPFLEYSVNGRVPQNPGNRDWAGAAAPHGCYRARGEDQWVNITVATDEEWGGFCRALGNPEWTRDAKFKDAVSRWENQDALDACVEAWTRELDKYEIMHLLQRHGVPAGAVMDEEDCYKDPHLAARGYFEEIPHPEVGTHSYPGMFFKFSETRLGFRRHPVRLGEDNEYVYKQLLRYSEEEYADLERQGHIGMDYAPGVK